MFLLSYLVGMWLSPDKSKVAAPESIYMSNCDLTAASCHVNVNDQVFVISLVGDPSPLEAFFVNVLVEGNQPLSIDIEFTMDGMDMGFNKYQLKLVDNVWKVKSILPICTLGSKDWNLIVRLNLKESEKIAYFKLKQKP